MLEYVTLLEGKMLEIKNSSDLTAIMIKLFWRCIPPPQPPAPASGPDLDQNQDQHITVYVNWFDLESVLHRLHFGRGRQMSTDWLEEIIRIFVPLPSGLKDASEGTNFTFLSQVPSKSAELCMFSVFWWSTLKVMCISWRKHKMHEWAGFCETHVSHPKWYSFDRALYTDRCFLTAMVIYSWRMDQDSIYLL